MAGTIIADKIQTENAFLTLNVGQTLVATINSSGILNSSGGIMVGANGSVSNTAITGVITSSQLATSLNLATNNVQVASIQSATGTPAITFAANGQITTANAPFILTGGQIKFPGTQSASSDANTLDDYEEGTFTPTFTNLSGGAIKTGAYVKIGRMVYVNIFFQNMGCTGTNGATIDGLPFTRSPLATSDGDALSSYELYNITTPSGGTQWLWSIGNGTSVYPFSYNGSTGASFNTSNFSSASATLGISGWYQAA